LSDSGCKNKMLCYVMLKTGIHSIVGYDGLQLKI